MIPEAKIECISDVMEDWSVRFLILRYALEMREVGRCAAVVV
jgi:hypothetical protein